MNNSFVGALCFRDYLKKSTLDALVFDLRFNDNEDEISFIIREIGRRKDQSVAKIITPYLKHSNENILIAAIDALGDMEVGSEYLLELLENKSHSAAIVSSAEFSLLKMGCTPKSL